MRFFNRVQTLREAGAVGGFLVGISVHVVHAELARRRRRRWLRLTPTGVAPDISSHQPNADAREAVARYYQQLEALGPKDRSIFVSRTIEGLKIFLSERDTVSAQKTWCRAEQNWLRRSTSSTGRVTAAP